MFQSVPTDSATVFILVFELQSNSLDKNIRSLTAFPVLETLAESDSKPLRKGFPYLDELTREPGACSARDQQC